MALWLYGWGYDHVMLEEGRHPNRDDLDKVSTEVPVAIIHYSGHMMVLNSKALELADYDANTINPEGGVIRRRPGTGEPDGIIEEQAIKPLLLQLMTSAQGEKAFELLDRAQDLYIANGFTSALEMAGTPDLVEGFSAYAAQGRLKIDLSTAVLAVVQPATETAVDFSLEYNQRFRVVGGKLNLDGGTPGKTAFLREPYHKQDEGMPADYRGYSSITEQAEIDDLVASFYAKRIPLFIHALGDASIDQAIQAVSAAREAHPREDVRQQLIHLQVLNEDQMQTLKSLDTSLTFQITHNYYFADFHAIETLGPERTEKLCPVGTAWREGFNVTLHHDAPVHPVDQLDLIWMAVNRTSRSGKVYGPEEVLTPYQALQASTLKAAWEFFEEKDKGSLEVGKLADMIVLDQNPLTVDAQTIKDINVNTTIKEGRTIWQRN